MLLVLFFDNGKILKRYIFLEGFVLIGSHLEITSLIFWEFLKRRFDTKHLVLF